MQEKQGKEKLKLVKEEKDKTNKYLLQNNRITLIAICIGVLFLVILIVAIIFTGESLL
jgi:uncharacterized membrane protein